VKIDKTFLSRLNLRRGGVNRWLAGQELKVLDLGAGEGLLWSELKKQYAVTNYVAVDKKPQIVGTIGCKVDVSLLSRIGLSAFNVIDVETDSDVLEIWLTLAMYIQTPTGVFLTVRRPSKAWVDSKSRAISGIPKEWVNVPANEKLWEWIEKGVVQRGMGYAHADENYLTFSQGNKISGYAFWCPGRNQTLT
jgi:hypothetical protein